MYVGRVQKTPSYDLRNVLVGASSVTLNQTPQRFHDRKDWNDPDPLGNQAATQFDIVNSGRDGAGGALSCGQGSVWRVQVGRVFLLCFRLCIFRCKLFLLSLLLRPLLLF